MQPIAKAKLCGCCSYNAVTNVLTPVVESKSCRCCKPYLENKLVKFTCIGLDLLRMEVQMLDSTCVCDECEDGEYILMR